MRRSLLLGPAIVPTELVEIDWTHPLAQGISSLVLMLYGNTPVALTRGSLYDGIYANGATIGAGVAGPGQIGVNGYFQASSTYSPNPARGSFASYFTASFSSGSVPVTDPILAEISDSSNNFFGFDDYSSNNSVQIGWVVGGVDNRLTTPNGGLWNANESLVVGGTWDTTASSRTLYTGGILRNSSSATFSTTTIGSGTLSVGGTSGYPSLQTWNNSAAGAIYSVAWWDDVLSSDLMAWLAAEPFAMLRPRARRQYYAASNSVLALFGRANAVSAGRGAVVVDAAMLGRSDASGAARAVVGAHAGLSGRGGAAGVARGAPSGTAVLAGTTAAGASPRGPVTALAPLAARTTAQGTGRGAVAGLLILLGRVLGAMFGRGALTAGTPGALRPGRIAAARPRARSAATLPVTRAVAASHRTRTARALPRA